MFIFRHVLDIISLRPFTYGIKSLCSPSTLLPWFRCLFFMYLAATLLGYPLAWSTPYRCSFSSWRTLDPEPQIFSALSLRQRAMPAFTRWRRRIKEALKIQQCQVRMNLDQGFVLRSGWKPFSMNTPFTSPSSGNDVTDDITNEVI